jgi:CRP-like cAMP-binding protein
VLRKNAKVELISRVPLFSDLSKKELGEVASIADEIDLPAGRKLVTQGELGREFFVIIEGSVKVAKNDRKVNELHAGDFFGEVALLTRAHRNATVTATSPVRVLVITDTAFRSLTRRMSSISPKLLAQLAQRVDDTI